MANTIATAVITVEVRDNGELHTDVEFEGTPDAGLRARARVMLNALAQHRAKEALEDGH